MVVDYYFSLTVPWQVNVGHFSEAATHVHLRLSHFFLCRNRFFPTVKYKYFLPLNSQSGCLVASQSEPISVSRIPFGARATQAEEGASIF